MFTGLIEVSDDISSKQDWYFPGSSGAKLISIVHEEYGSTAPEDEF